ncbi:ankyrin repeat-containing domain protein [Aspergillus germanicus]
MAFKTAESSMASLCLNYLHHDDFIPHSGKLVAACAMDDEVVLCQALGLFKNRDRVTLIARATEKLNFRGMPSHWIHEGISPVHLCAWFGLADLVQRLHNRGHDINVPDGRCKRTPLRYACVRGHVGIVKELLELKAQPNWLPIIDAVSGLPPNERRDGEETGRVEIARLIQSRRGLTLNDGIDHEGTTVLMFAVKHGYCDFVEMLLRDTSVDVDARDVHGRTALWFAVEECRAELVAVKSFLEDGLVGLLLRHGADPNVRYQMSGKTLLSHAMETNNPAAVAALLRRGKSQVPVEKELVNDTISNDQPGVLDVADCVLLSRGLSDVSDTGKNHRLVESASQWEAKERSESLDSGIDLAEKSDTPSAILRVRTIEFVPKLKRASSTVEDGEIHDRKRVKIHEDTAELI